jgi:hypothetical protein
MTKMTLATALWTCGIVAMTSAAGQDVRSTPAPTFNKDVAPILYKNCTNCHRPGEIAPMPLLTYQDARPWAKSIGRQVSLGAMPPWHGESQHHDFLNDRRLSEAEKATLVGWANGGAPEGDRADLTPAPSYTEGWQIGQPDAVFAINEDYPVRADGTIAYQYFEVPTNIDEDRFIEAIEARPGNRAVVHHVIVYARPQQPEPRPSPFKFAAGMDRPAGSTGAATPPPEKQKPLGPDARPAPRRLGAMIGAFAPGQMARVYQPGTALRLTAGTTLVFQIHYTANGTATTDRTKIGLRFAKQPPGSEVRTAALSNGNFAIPPGAADYRVDAQMTLVDDVVLWSVLPHTHVRGSRWEYEITYPDGRTETLLSVPRYDFNWQTEYVFKTPVSLPKGTTVRSSAWYDNSPRNRSNPDPTAEVHWGDQTWEEMQWTALIYTVGAPAATSADGASAGGRR